MPYCILRWIGSGSSAHMQHQNPFCQPIFGNTGEGIWAFPTCHTITLAVAYTCISFPPLCSFPSWVALVDFTATAPSVQSTAVTHGPFPYISVPVAHQVPLLHICSASWMKLHEGLQHNMYRAYQCEQWAF